LVAQSRALPWPCLKRLLSATCLGMKRLRSKRRVTNERGRFEEAASLGAISSPEILEAIDCQLGVADGVLDILVTQVVLQRSRVVAIVGQPVAAGVP